MARPIEPEYIIPNGDEDPGWSMDELGGTQYPELYPLVASDGTEYWKFNFTRYEGMIISDDSEFESTVILFTGLGNICLEYDDNGLNEVSFSPQQSYAHFLFVLGKYMQLEEEDRFAVESLYTKASGYCASRVDVNIPKQEVTVTRTNTPADEFGDVNDAEDNVSGVSVQRLEDFGGDRITTVTDPESGIAVDCQLTDDQVILYLTAERARYTIRLNREVPDLDGFFDHPVYPLAKSMFWEIYIEYDDPNNPEAPFIDLTDYR